MPNWILGVDGKMRKWHFRTRVFWNAVFLSKKQIYSDDKCIEWCAKMTYNLLKVFDKMANCTQKGEREWKITMKN
jgi:hypothetical protein